MIESVAAILLALLIGAASIYGGVSLLATRRRVEGWPTVTGTVIDRGVELSAVASPSTPGSRYRAIVRYAYVVNGQRYEGDKIFALGGLTGSKETMQREVDALPAALEIRYDPQNPADACLKLAPAWWAYAAFGGAALCLLVGLITLVSWLATGK